MDRAANATIRDYLEELTAGGEPLGFRARRHASCARPGHVKPLRSPAAALCARCARRH